MRTQVIEGTLEEVQRQLSALPFVSSKRLRVVVSESEQDEKEPLERVFAKAQRRNGLILIPTKNPNDMVTLELVKELSED